MLENQLINYSCEIICLSVVIPVTLTVLMEGDPERI
jgi:hypothetical protein